MPTKRNAGNPLQGVPLRLEAMSLEVPKVLDHPNRMEFTGILVRLDQPSDAPPHGSKGKRVLLTSAAAERALPSLLGMGVDLTVDLDGHDPTNKVGVITSAHIEGDAVHITGFVYASDFPRQALRIHLDQASLGFSFEAQQIAVESLDADPLVITDCIFTGAAILMKDLAAYRSTALAAAAAKKHETEFTMDDETKKALADLMASAIQPVHTAIDGLKSDLAAQGEKVAFLHEKVEANAVTMGKVEPLAGKLDNCAAAAEAAGVGLDPNAGHVVHMRKIASDMRAQAAMGKMPSSYSGGGYMGYQASAELIQPMAAIVAPRFEDSDAYKTLTAQLATAQTSMTEKLAAAADTISGLQTKIADIQASRRTESPAPDRKTLPPQITRLLAKEGIGDDQISDGKKLSGSMLSKITEGMTVQQRFDLKTKLSAVGLIDATISA